MADLEVRVRLGVDRRRNRDALGEVGPPLLRHGAEDRLGVAAGELAQPRRQRRKRAVVLQLVQQLLRAERCGGENDLLCGVRLFAAAQRAVRPHRLDLVATAVEGTHRGDRRERVHLGACLFGQVQVVTFGVVFFALCGQPVKQLGAVDTPRAARPGAAEVRVGDLLALVALAEEDTDVEWRETCDRHRGRRRSA